MDGLGFGVGKVAREASWDCESDEGVTEVIAGIAWPTDRIRSGGRVASSMRLLD